MTNFSAFLVALIIALSAPGIKAAEAKTVTLLAFGDSLTAGLGLSAGDAFPAQLEARLKREGYDIKIVGAGVSGETASGALTRAEWTLAQNPDFVILETGGNDMLRALPPAVTRGNIDKILDIMDAHKIPVLLAGMRAFGGLGPGFGGEYEKMYRDLAEKHHAVYYPFFLDGVAFKRELLQDDGLHPNAAGVGVIVENILPSVKKLLSKDSPTNGHE